MPHQTIALERERLCHAWVFRKCKTRGTLRTSMGDVRVLCSCGERCALHVWRLLAWEGRDRELNVARVRSLCLAVHGYDPEIEN